MVLKRVTVTNSHRKGLKKERVPVTIEVGDNNKKGTLCGGPI
jgi:hypothetical protein